MKVWVLTGQDIEDVMVIDGERTTFDIMVRILDGWGYDTKDIEVGSIDSVVAGDGWIVASRVDVE